MTLTELVNQSYYNAKLKGFHDEPREFGTSIALIHSELSEALEAHRHGENVAEEIADVAIRLGDLCGEYKIDLQGAVAKKMIKNAGRPRLHGKKY